MRLAASLLIGGGICSAKCVSAATEGDILPKVPHVLDDAIVELETAWNFAEQYSNKCFQVPNALCIGGTSQIVTANGVPEGLASWITFDHLYPMDQTGNGNHMHRTPRAGPGHNGHGASAAFVKGASSTIKSSPTLKSKDFTISFWMYLLSDSNGLFRNILSKGSETAQTPSLLLYPDSRKLSVRLSTTNSSSEGMPSLGSLPLRRWTHVAVTASENRLKLFLNGIKDNEVFLRGEIQPNNHDIIVGASVENPGFEGYIDDLRFYTRGLGDGEISSLTIPSLTGVSDTEFVSLGCDSCGYEFAMHSNMCGEPAAHLCSLQELYQGGIHAARINGLLNSKSDIWHSNVAPGESSAGERRMALCCSSESEELTR